MITNFSSTKVGNFMKNTNSSIKKYCKNKEKQEKHETKEKATKKKTNTAIYALTLIP